jgi:hypothetical protein
MFGTHSPAPGDVSLIAAFRTQVSQGWNGVRGYYGEASGNNQGCRSALVFALGAQESKVVMRLTSGKERAGTWYFNKQNARCLGLASQVNEKV